MKDRISVIVPIYGVEEYMDRCIESICAQTYENLQIILVDDKSPDRCPEKCEEWTKKDTRIEVVHKPENGGLGLTRNAGLAVVRGKYVTFIDSDDWLAQDHIEKLYQAICQEDADLAIGGHTKVMVNGEHIPHPVRFATGRYESQAVIDQIVLPLMGSAVDQPNDLMVSASSCMNLYRVDVIKDNHLQFISERYAESEDLFFNIDYLMQAKRVVVTDHIGYFYWENVTSISRRYNPKRFERTLHYYELLQQKAAAYGLEEKASLRIKRSFLMKIRVAIRHIVLASMPYKNKKKEIKNILENSDTHKALCEYPIDRYGRSMRLLSQWMRKGNVHGVYFMIWVREALRRSTRLKRIVKKVGIGA